MKKLFVVLSLMAALAAGSAQPTNTVPGIAKAWYDAQEGILDAKRWSVAPYGTYAPDAPHKVGGGVFVSYALSEYLSTGLGFDYLGQLTMPSGNVSLKLPVKISKVTVTPFAIAGIAVPVGGAGDANGNVAQIVGGGISSRVWSWKNADGSDKAGLDLGVAVTKWLNAGDYSGVRYQPFIAFRIVLP